MKDVLEKLKHIPIPIWIGLGLVLIFILLMNRNSSSSSGGTTAGLVTDSTVGSQGTQSGAGTDQQLGNLSQMNQTGFNEIMHQNQVSADQQTGILQSILANMNGVGTTMHQMGSSVQATQNATAQANAATGTAGQNTGSQPSGVSNHTLVGHYKVALPGGGDVTVNANSAQAAIENASQETGMDTSHSNVTTLSPPHSDI
jgi:hypothetical protein